HQTRQRYLAVRAEIAHRKLEEIVDRAALDRELAVHVELAEREIGIQRQTARRGGGMHADRDVAAIGRFGLTIMPGAAAMIDQRQPALLDDALENNIEQHA